MNSLRRHLGVPDGERGPPRERYLPRNNLPSGPRSPCRLPALHGDPFGRMLVTQAAVEGMTLVTSDAQLAKYPGSIRRVQ
ncbi:MAG: hypothetical protein ACREPF_07690 [Rhodanobacteraceae bacterium]